MLPISTPTEMLAVPFFSDLAAIVVIVIFIFAISVATSTTSPGLSIAVMPSVATKRLFSLRSIGHSASISLSGSRYLTLGQSARCIVTPRLRET